MKLRSMKHHWVLIHSKGFMLQLLPSTTETPLDALERGFAFNLNNS